MNKTLTLLLAAASCAAITAPPPSAQDVARAAATISSADLVERIRVISSDDFEGRAPGTHGEKVTLEYLVREFKAIGLAPGNPDGTYLQKVPLSEFRSQPSARVRLPQGREIAWKQPEDFIAFSYERKPRVKIEDSPLVFVGYGVVAPEYRWDDFKGMDLRGKTLVVLVNDPQVPDPRDPSKLDESMFKGKAMTYYGRWTYKYEGREVGAAAVIIVHETHSPVSLRGGGELVGRENSRSAAPRARSSLPSPAGWLETAKAPSRPQATPETLRQAAPRGTSPVVLGPAISFDVANSWREVDSYNVVARIEGADPKRRGSIVHTAHWDHFGWTRSRPAPRRTRSTTGPSTMPPVSRPSRACAGVGLPPRAPSRSVLFICTTGGARPRRALLREEPALSARTHAGQINIDMNHGGDHGQTISGMGHSSLDEIATRIAATQGRRTHPEARPEQGGFFRSDHLPFVRAGVPAANMGGGTEFIGKPPTFYREMSDAFTSERYHKVRDTLQPDYDFSGAIEDLRLLFTLGNEVAETDVYPSWQPGSEFHR
jgi:Zn-dependent M28 family amino/carboxypeptidase